MICKFVHDKTLRGSCLEARKVFISASSKCGSVGGDAASILMRTQIRNRRYLQRSAEIGKMLANGKLLVLKLAFGETPVF
jgi:hypothetical protein